ncbi:MAG: hypothetical protein M3N53_05875 [Actinomycetota bacterium]|nr:hypothetical protein [Actinomycetota bacterium]
MWTAIYQGGGAASTPTAPDLGCSISPTETSCTVDYTRTSPPGTDSITGFFADAGINDTADPRDTVSKTWVAPTATRLDCADETATNPTGTAYVVTCTATSDSGQPVSGAQVDVEATGANDPDAGDTPVSPDFTCTTGADGTCTFTQTGTAAGTTTYRAFLDGDNNNATGGPDATEGQDEKTAPGATAEPDATDVVTKTWTAGGPPQGPVCPGFEDDPRNQIVGTPVTTTSPGPRDRHHLRARRQRHDLGPWR